MTDIMLREFVLYGVLFLSPAILYVVKLCVEDDNNE